MPELVYVVDPVGKSLTAVKNVSFSDIGIRERNDLEAWVLANPEILGEKLLVVTSEFDRFDRSDRRLDVLALDEDGRLVVIELKLELTGSFADQQAVRYAAFCSTMTIKEVVQAHSRFHKCSDEESRRAILAFLDVEELPELGNQPRIVLAGGELDDQELTSTVLWLRTFGVDISCVEIKPYRLPETNALILVPRVIIPLPEARDYLIRVEQKQANTAKVAKDVQANTRTWQTLADRFNALPGDFRAVVRPSKRFLQIPIGHREMHYEWTPLASQGILRVALHFEANDREINEQRVGVIKARAESIQSGVSHPFAAEMWGSKWATAEFRLPWDVNAVSDRDLDEALHVMQLLIERTWPIVERLKAEAPE